MLHVNPLFIGTANPFTGLEMLLAPGGVGGTVYLMSEIDATPSHTSLSIQWIVLIIALIAVALGSVSWFAYRHRRVQS